jgi:hypothetical protein
MYNPMEQDVLVNMVIEESCLLEYNAVKSVERHGVISQKTGLFITTAV